MPLYYRRRRTHTISERQKEREMSNRDKFREKKICQTNGIGKNRFVQVKERLNYHRWPCLNEIAFCNRLNGAQTRIDEQKTRRVKRD